jgi:hypothetical protein
MRGKTTKRPTSKHEQRQALAHPLGEAWKELLTRWVSAGFLQPLQILGNAE